MNDEVGRAASSWLGLGSDDPMWAALTDRKRGSWTEEEFLASGRDEVARVLAIVAGRGIELQRRSALDFGCGPGRLSAALAREGFEKVIGVDAADSMIHAARKLVEDPRCEFVLNSGGDLSKFDDGSIDFLYSCRVLQHIPPAASRRFIAEFVRITRPGGTIAFQLPSAPAPGVLGLAMRVLPEELLNRARRGMRMSGVPVDEVEAIVESSGGRVVAVVPDSSSGPRWTSHLYIVAV